MYGVFCMGVSTLTLRAWRSDERGRRVVSVCAVINSFVAPVRLGF